MVVSFGSGASPKVSTTSVGGSLSVAPAAGVEAIRRACPATPWGSHSSPSRARARQVTVRAARSMARPRSAERYAWR
jgi:hypothetical protein